MRPPAQFLARLPHAHATHSEREIEPPRVSIPFRCLQTQRQLIRAARSLNLSIQCIIIHLGLVGWLRPRENIVKAITTSSDHKSVPCVRDLCDGHSAQRWPRARGSFGCRCRRSRIRELCRLRQASTHTTAVAAPVVVVVVVDVDDAWLPL